MKTILFVPDCHVPYHDAKAFKLLLKVGQAIKPDIVVLLGDFIDCYQISTHDKDPQRRISLLEEAREAKDLLREIQNLGAKQNIFIEGNHEDRIRRYFSKRAPELYGFVSTPKLLDLNKDTGWEFYRYGTYAKVCKIYVAHDAGYCGLTAARKTSEAFQHNVVFGHTHALSATYSGNVLGERHVCINAGWLGDCYYADYMHVVKQRNWQLGFAVGSVGKDGAVHINAIPIIDYECFVEGKVYSV